MFICPYTDKCDCAIEKDCSTQLKANELLKESTNNRMQARILILICQANRKFRPCITEVK